VLGLSAVGAAALSALGSGANSTGTALRLPAPVRPAVTPTADPAVRVTPQRERQAVDLLRRALQAGRTQRYLGTKFVSAWSPAGATSVVVDVEHTPGHGLSARVAATPTSPGGSAVGPTSATTTSYHGTFPRTDSRALDRLQASYDVTVNRQAAGCAGRAARLVDVRRPGSSALAARYWVDTRTDLLLRQEAYDRAGRTVRASAFLQLTTPPGPLSADDVGAQADPGTSPGAAQAALQTAESGELLDERALDRLRRSGWVLPARLPHGLELYEARRRSDPAGPVVHLSYGDGLSTVSVFAQRGRLEARTLAGWQQHSLAGTTVFARPALSQRLSWAGGDTVYTVVADAPWETVEAIVRDLPHATPSSGLPSRVARGVRRVASWVNPFG